MRFGVGGVLVCGDCKIAESLCMEILTVLRGGCRKLGDFLAFECIYVCSKCKDDDCSKCRSLIIERKFMNKRNNRNGKKLADKIVNERTAGDKDEAKA